MPRITPLSATQLLVLTTAAERADHSVYPLPATLRAHGASRSRLLGSLLQRGLLKELRTKNDALVWRQDQSGCQYTLRITTAGLSAIGGGPIPCPPLIGSKLPRAAAAADAVTKRKPPDRTPAQEEIVTSELGRPAGKLGRVLTAVETQAGATLPELVTLTGWLPHSTRAAITRLRQRGFALHLTDQDGRKAYRVEGPA